MSNYNHYHNQSSESCCTPKPPCVFYVPVPGPTGTMGPLGFTGRMGPQGYTGIMGPMGFQGPIGPQGYIGTMGQMGLTGPQGPTGFTGTQGPAGTMGQIGLTGAQGPTGLTGIQGLSGGLISVADFYALMPGDNNATVASGTPVRFPQDGPASGGIVRSSATEFVLPDIGIYEVNFQVSILESGQLVIVLNGAELPYTVVGRATGASQIIGITLVTTTLTNSLLSVNNPLGSITALTITSIAGGVDPVSAHLVIKRVI